MMNTAAGTTHAADAVTALHVRMQLWQQVMGEPTSKLSVKLMEDPHNLARYAAFLVARQVKASTLAGHVTTIKKVLTWWASRGAEERQYIKLQAVIKWVEVFSRQCKNVAVPPTHTLQRVNLPSAKQVMIWQLQVDGHADRMLAEDVKRHGRMYRQETAKACQDSALLAICFGHLPPARLQCIRTAVHPDHALASGGCMDPDCR